MINTNTTEPQIMPLVCSALSKYSGGMGVGVTVGLTTSVAAAADWGENAPDAGSGQAKMINARIAISKRIQSKSYF